MTLFPLDSFTSCNRSASVMTPLVLACWPSDVTPVVGMTDVPELTGRIEGSG